MHYKDGTPATLGDIIVHDSGAVGIVIGGTIGSDFCSTHAVMFKGPKQPNYNAPTPGFVGLLRDEKGNVVASAAVMVDREQALQTRECLKIGHVDITVGELAPASPAAPN